MPWEISEALNKKIKIPPLGKSMTEKKHGGDQWRAGEMKIFNLLP